MTTCLVLDIDLILVHPKQVSATAILIASSILQLCLNNNTSISASVASLNISQAQSSHTDRISYQGKKRWPLIKNEKSFIIINNPVLRFICIQNSTHQRLITFITTLNTLIFLLLQIYRCIATNYNVVEKFIYFSNSTQIVELVY